MAQWYNISTATGKIKAEQNSSRMGIDMAVYSNTGTGVCELWRSSPDISINTTTNTITFIEGGGSKDTITRGSGSWVTDGLEAGDVITCCPRVIPKVSNSNDGIYTLFSVVTLTLTLIATDDLAAETQTTQVALTVTNRGVKILSFVKTAGEKIFHFPKALRGEAYSGSGEGDLYAVLPATVTLSVIGRNSLLGD